MFHIFVLGHYAADEIKEKIDDLDQKWLEFKVETLDRNPKSPSPPTPTPPLT